jgi:adenosine deaminase
VELQEFIRALPKAELHLHIEGSLEPDMMFEMARRNGVTLPYATVEETRAAYAFTNLQTFLDIYYAGAAALRQEQDFYELAMAYFRRAKADGVVHAEIFFDPQTHTARGIAFETVLNGLERAASDAKAELGVSSRLLLCFLRHLPEADAFATLAQARPHLQRIHGVGLDSSEKGHPPAKFQRVFAQCRELGLHLVAHAGEEGPAANVRDSLDLLKTERIDHGVRAIEDPALLARLVREQIPLTVCPLSNIKLRVFPSMEQHNLKQLLDLGLRVTLNSDDPAYFGGYIGQNFLATAQALKLSRNELVTLARNSLLASFVTAAERAPWLAQLEKVASA